MTAFGDLLLVTTAQGVADPHQPSPAAPVCFAALDKNSGRVYWTDGSPGDMILHGQWSSPAAGVLAGRPQAIFAGGDGWVYSFRADKGTSGRPRLLWKFDANPKDSKWILGARGTRNNILAAPVIHGGLVYVAVGQDPEQGEGPGAVHCIDPSGSGDVSSHLVVRGAAARPGARRLQAADPERGDRIVANPNSALVWTYRGRDRNGDGGIDFEETMHRAVGGPTIADRLLFIADYSGLLHCLDARTGEVQWTHDLLAAVWSTPLVADGALYVCDEDGDIAVFSVSRKKKLLAENHLGVAVYGAPAAVDETLYIAAKNRLLAIGVDAKK